MTLEERVNKVCEWACGQSPNHCIGCRYSICIDWNNMKDSDSWICPFDEVIKACEDKKRGYWI